MPGSKMIFFSETKRVEMHNIIGTKRDEDNFIYKGGKRSLKTPVLILVLYCIVL
jgi:hypothetical protein